MNLSKRRKSYHQSSKAGLIYCDSSYELKAALILDEDTEVITYENHLGFLNKNGKQRFIDFLVTYKDLSKKLIEIKPFRRICQFEDQIIDNKEWAANNNYGFMIWSEIELGFKSEYDATQWADQYLSKIHGIDYVESRKELSRQKAKRHYDAKIANDKILLFCEYCKENHEPLRLTHDKNIKKNGRYICEKEGGHIAGSRPKPHLQKINPHANIGMKQCIKCNNILPLENFSEKKAQCKECRAKHYKEKYQKK